RGGKVTRCSPGKARGAAPRVRSPFENSVIDCAGITPPWPPLHKGGKGYAVLTWEAEIDSPGARSGTID
ncbi:MAG: hypothetical protein ACHRXM_15585, partial [Isosphaerales bacterium]